MPELKTLADLKRAMTVGTKVHVENHVYPHLSGDRKVLVAQTNSWCLSFPESHPKAAEHEGSWLSVPKASECTFNGNAVTIIDEGAPFCTITVPTTT